MQRAVDLSILDGFNFRKFFEFLKSITPQGNLCFYPDGISYDGCNDPKNPSVYVSSHIKSKNLTHYELFEPEGLCVPIDPGNVADDLKNTKKKNSLRVYIFKEQNVINLMKVGGNSIGAIKGLKDMLPQTEEYFPKTVLEYPRMAPVSVLEAETFEENCKRLTGGSDNKHVFIGLYGKRGHKVAMYHEDIGSNSCTIICSRNKNNDKPNDSGKIRRKIVWEISVKCDIVKSLVLLTKMSSGVIQLYFGMNLPLKVSCLVGTMGRVDVFLCGRK